jgi:RNA polymerase sigma factor (sigma-70 family)
VTDSRGAAGARGDADGSEQRTVDAAAAAEFELHRSLLSAAAYRMLGSATDAEDVLQDVWLLWTRRPRGDVRSARSYLVRMTVNRCLDVLDRPERRREALSSWLPEPLLGDPLAAPVHLSVSDPTEAVLHAESLSMALLVVLETLSPLERAVFVLHESFGYEHAEIARILDKSPAAVRQLAHRSREHVRARRPRYPVDAHRRRAVTDRFVAAVTGGDIDAFMRLLAPDVELYTDGGGRVRAARRVIVGRDKVVRLFRGPKVARFLQDIQWQSCLVNDDPGALLVSAGHLRGVLVAEPTEDGTTVRAIYVQLDPAKVASAMASR